MAGRLIFDQNIVVVGILNCIHELWSDINSVVVVVCVNGLMGSVLSMLSLQSSSLTKGRDRLVCVRVCVYVCVRECVCVCVCVDGR